MSLVITVSRYRQTDELTQGLLFAGGTNLGYTIENPWKDNRRNVSCIPTGEYDTVIRKGSDSPSRDYDHLHLQDVPERDWILFHVANYAHEVEGCIAPGKTASPGMVGHSQKCFNELMDRAKKADEILTRVTNVNITGR